MIRKLNQELGISAQTLIKDYESINGWKHGVDRKPRYPFGLLLHMYVNPLLKTKH
jgi:hypothetical protein